MQVQAPNYIYPLLVASLHSFYRLSFCDYISWEAQLQNGFVSVLIISTFYSIFYVSHTCDFTSVQGAALET